MIKSSYAVLAMGILLTGCVVSEPSHRHDHDVVVVAPALPSMVLLDTDRIYFYAGYYYFYRAPYWGYSRSRSGPWVDLPRDRYPMHIRFKEQEQVRDHRDKDGDRGNRDSRGDDHGKEVRDHRDGGDRDDRGGVEGSRGKDSNYRDHKDDDKDVRNNRGGNPAPVIRDFRNDTDRRVDTRDHRDDDRSKDARDSRNKKDDKDVRDHRDDNRERDARESRDEKRYKDKSQDRDDDRDRGPDSDRNYPSRP